MYNGQQVVQAFNHQKQAKKKFRALNEALRDSARKAEVTAGSVSPITTLVNDMGYVVCAAIGCLWAIAGKIAVGNVQAMLEYTWRFAEPFSSLAGMVGSFGAAAAAGGASLPFWTPRRRSRIRSPQPFQKSTMAASSFTRSNSAIPRTAC